MQAENPIYVISFSLSENGEGEEQNRTDGRSGKMNIPRIMIAAAGSGSGKTLLSCALMMLFHRKEKASVPSGAGRTISIRCSIGRCSASLPGIWTLFHWGETDEKPFCARGRERRPLR